MWISILNYNIGQIEVADITDFDLDTNNTDANTIAEMWLLSNDYNPDEISGKVHPMMSELAKQLVKQVYPE